jgi:hypothetical protein
MPSLIVQLCNEFSELKDRLASADAELAVFRKYNTFQHGKIYKIDNSEDEMIYVGCTCLPLVERFAIHRKKTGTGKMKIHKHMKKLGRNNFSIHLVKEVPTYSRWHLEKQEYAIQMTVPEEHRLFKSRPRIPFGLSYAEKNALYARNWYLGKVKRSLHQANVDLPAHASDASDSEPSSE